MSVPYYRKDVDSKLSKFTDISWKKFKESANRRQDSINELMQECWDGGPKGGYHRQCYQLYTNKEHVARAERKFAEVLDLNKTEPSSELSAATEPLNKRMC